MKTIDEKIFKHSLLLPTLFVLLLWIVTIVENVLGLSFYTYGVFPRTLSGLQGIFLMPFIHSGFKHLFSNSIPLIVMGSGVIYFYRSLSYKVFIIIWLVTGFSVWIGGRASYHIGASGIVYGLAAFLFFSGAIRRDPRLAAISLAVVFLYGGMFWGVFPLWPSISWEGHLFGGVTGFACAVGYRHQGPQRVVYSWETESPDEQDEVDADYLNEEPQN